MFETITANTTLTFPIELIDGTKLQTVAEAARYMAKLSEDRRLASHWKIAIRMLDHAMKEPSYLKTATMSLQSAVLLDGNLLANQS